MCLAVPGQVLSIEGEGIERMGRVSFGGIVKQVSLAYTPEAHVGDYVYVHVGFALSTVDEAEAAHVFAYLDAMGELAELDLDAGEAGEVLCEAQALEVGEFHHAKEVMA
jgi:hydrogenase expression/formation protein HypC